MMDTKLESELKQIIHPDRAGRYIDEAGAAYDQELKVWRALVPKIFFDSLENIKAAYLEERAIPREEILKLAVAVNQVSRHTWSFIGSQFGSLNLISYIDLAKAADLCEKYKFKGLTKANDDSWSGHTSKLENKIMNALNRGGAGEVHCRVCGRLRTNGVSIRRGIGPKCWRKGGF